MSRLIEADALIEILAVMQGRCNTKAELIHNSKIWQQVKDMPTVDAVPVVHGAWRSTEGLYTNGICYCSICETEYYFSDLYDVGEEAQSRLPNFCPHCGAMMNWEEVVTDNAKRDGEA